MRVLLLAPNYDAQVPGESWSTYKWVQGISACCDTVVLTQHGAGWDAQKSPVPAQEIVNWDEPKVPGMKGRIAHELKPAYFVFYYRARRWIKQALKRGERFDIVHQINPLALRYPCPARNLGLTYVMGPLAGSLPTPAAFKSTTPERQWYRKLRSLDGWRLRNDPWLKSSYRGAAALIGVAPYVEELFPPGYLQRFATMAETGVESVATQPKASPLPGEPLRLLFVGRLIRTKGILEAIESVAQARITCQITFDIVGAGELSTECEQLITRLKLNDIVKLHGRQTKEEVFQWYDRSHVFLFPSYREPSGNVVFEAMSRGLPVIGSSVGGPGYVITERCGARITPSSRDAFVAGLAEAVQAISAQPTGLTALSTAALQRMAEIALWPQKIAGMTKFYEELVQPRQSP